MINITIDINSDINNNTDTNTGSDLPVVVNVKANVDPGLTYAKLTVKLVPLTPTNILCLAALRKASVVSIFVSLTDQIETHVVRRETDPVSTNLFCAFTFIGGVETVTSGRRALMTVTFIEAVLDRVLSATMT